MAAASRRASRANQIDALRVDAELHTVLCNSAKNALRFYPPAVTDALLPEIALMLRSLMFANTVAVDVPSPGLVYSNLRFRRSGHAATRFGVEGQTLTRAQKAVHFLLSVVLPYLSARMERYAGDGEHPRLERVIRVMQGATRMLDALNGLLFLCKARFRTVADRAAGAELVYADLDATRRPSMELLNRQLVWQGVAQFALFVAPLVASVRIPAFLRGVLARAGSGPDERGPGRGGCPECGTTDMVMPHTALPCRCVFCYACVAAPLEKDVEYKCRRCHMAVHSLRRVCR